MTFSPDHNQTHWDRQAELRVWMIRNKVTFVQLGVVMGNVTASAVQKSVRRPHMPVRNHKALVEFGVPAELLPPPLNVPSGPKPKAKVENSSPPKIHL